MPPWGNANNFATVIVIGLLTSVIFYRPLSWLVLVWLNDSSYSHGFLIPLISALLVWRLRDKLTSLPASSNPWGLGLLGLSLLLALFAISRQAYYIASLLLLVVLAGLVLYLKGWAVVRLLLFPIAYLSMMVPLPFVRSLSPRLQLWTSGFASSVANLVAVPVQQEGTAVSVPNAAFVVGLACSGLNSIVALTAVGTLLVYLLKGQPWARTALIASIIPIALVANGLRIGALLWVAYHFGGEVGLTFHDTFAGFLSWAMAIGFFLVGSKLLRCRFNLVA